MSLEAERCAQCTLSRENAVHASAETCRRFMTETGRGCANPMEHHDYVRPITCFACERVLPPEKP